MVNYLNAFFYTSAHWSTGNFLSSLTCRNNSCAYFDFWLDSCCRSHRGCRSCGRRRTPPCDLLHNKIPPSHSQSRSGPTGRQTATPLHVWCWYGLGQIQEKHLRKKQTTLALYALYTAVTHVINTEYWVFPCIIVVLCQNFILSLPSLPLFVVMVTSQSAGGSHGPAGTTVLWDVLVPCDAHIILPLDVPPVPRWRKHWRIHIHARPGPRSVVI